MTIIDRYLLKNFLGVFAVFFISFFGLFVVGDAVNNFGELQQYAESHGGLLRVVLEYYGLRALVFFRLDESPADSRCHHVYDCFFSTT